LPITDTELNMEALAIMELAEAFSSTGLSGVSVN
jgi:hypothetical protein